MTTLLSTFQRGIFSSSFAHHCFIWYTIIIIAQKSKISSNILYEDSKTKSQKKVGIKYKKNHLDISGNKFFPINKNKRMSNKITN